MWNNATNCRNVAAALFGEHTRPRVLVSAPSPKVRGKKVGTGEGASASTRGRVRSPENAERYAAIANQIYFTRTLSLVTDT